MKINPELTIFEEEALLEFLKDNINRESLSKYEGCIPRYLFLAFVKLQKAVDTWHEAMGYTE